MSSSHEAQVQLVVSYYGTPIMNDPRLLLTERSLLHHRWFVQPTLCFAAVFFNLCFACL